MERYDLRLPPDRVAALKRLAGRLTYEGDGQTVLWTDLVRQGIDWVLEAGGRRLAPPGGPESGSTNPTP
jgi:hypothetical protein